MKKFYFYAIVIAITIVMLEFMSVEKQSIQQYFNNVIALLILCELCKISSDIKK